MVEFQEQKPRRKQNEDGFKAGINLNSRLKNSTTF